MTSVGVYTCRGELYEHDGFQYTLHYHDEFYGITELSTGFGVCSVSRYTSTVDNMPVKKYLLQQMKERKITDSVLKKVKKVMKRIWVDYPLNERF